jgi:tetratricopeptide (TPR) repeat protein
MKKIITLLTALFFVSNVYGQTPKEYFNRAVAKLNLQDYRGAIVDFTKAIELNPNFAEVYFHRGMCKAILEDYRGAIVDFTKAIGLNPNYAEAYFHRGVSKLLLEQKDSGCLDLSKAGELGFAKAYESIQMGCN